MDDMNAMIQPLQPLSPKGMGTMHAGVIQNDDGKGIRVFLRNELIESGDHGRRRHRLGRRAVDQFALPTQEPQHVQPVTVGIGRNLPGLTDRTPRIGH